MPKAKTKRKNESQAGETSKNHPGKYLIRFIKKTESGDQLLFASSRGDIDDAIRRAELEVACQHCDRADIYERKKQITGDQ